MEVGAVKQAFNNEVILLKKNLNQARIQVIHKLTRRAKQFTEKKAPEKLKEKFKKKAESAVNEVLIIKKIKAKDLAKFIVTHTGELKDYLNKPKVDHDKACARLLLHKSLQEKYKYIRSRYSNIEIKDLFMSRQERRKLKKEAREKQKKKLKAKGDNKVTSAEGDWDVEDINMAEDSKLSNDIEESDNGSDVESDKNKSEHENESESENDTENENESISENESEYENEFENENESNSEKEGSIPKDLSSLGEVNRFSDSDESSGNGYRESLSDKSKEEIKNKVETKKSNKIINKLNEASSVKDGANENTFSKSGAMFSVKNITDKRNMDEKIKKHEKKHKDNKNKNLNEKLILRKFKKDINEPLMNTTKVVDPFFITATGENYISLAEPRQPDEVKEIHKQGNRRQRRAAMFGHILPDNKPRRDFGNDKFNKHNGSDSFKNNRSSNNKIANSNDSFKKSNSKSFNSMSLDDKPEKLHPSWEAKKMRSGLLPFEGKKIVFDEG